MSSRNQLRLLSMKLHSNNQKPGCKVDRFLQNRLKVSTLRWPSPNRVHLSLRGRLSCQFKSMPPHWANAIFLRQSAAPKSWRRHLQSSDVTNAVELTCTELYVVKIRNLWFVLHFHRRMWAQGNQYGDGRWPMEAAAYQNVSHDQGKDLPNICIWVKINAHYYNVPAI